MCILVAMLAMVGATAGGEPRYTPPGVMGGFGGGGPFGNVDPAEQIASIRQWISQSKKRIAEIEAKLPATQKKAESMPLPLEVQQTVADKSILHAAARQAIDAIIAKHHTNLQAQELELVGLQARREAIQRAMADQSERLKVAVKDDAIAAQLQQVVSAKEQYLAHLKQMHEVGRSGTAELSQAMAAVADARARLLERQETVADRAGGDVLAAWNRELMNLSVDLAEKQAVLKVMEMRLEAIRSAWKAHRELALLQSELETCHRDFAMAEEELRQLEKQTEPAPKE
jgi:hypothetical protein